MNSGWEEAPRRTGHPIRLGAVTRTFSGLRGRGFIYRSIGGSHHRLRFHSEYLPELEEVLSAFGARPSSDRRCPTAADAARIPVHVLQTAIAVVWWGQAEVGLHARAPCIG